MNTTAFEACRDFIRIWNQLKVHLMAAAEVHDLTIQQVFALYMLQDAGGIPMGAVASRLHCDASNVTSIVDHLEELQYVRREEAPHDRRKKCLVLTPKGTKVITSIMAKLPVEMGFDKLTPEELNVLSAISQKLNLA